MNTNEINYYCRGGVTPPGNFGQGNPAPTETIYGVLL